MNQSQTVFKYLQGTVVCSLSPCFHRKNNVSRRTVGRNITTLIQLTFNLTSIPSTLQPLLSLTTKIAQESKAWSVISATVDKAVAVVPEALSGAVCLDHVMWELLQPVHRWAEGSSEFGILWLSSWFKASYISLHSLSSVIVA